jgi:redox-sensing transcriptional repressor
MIPFMGGKMKKISDSTINRLSKYYRTLERLQEQNTETVSSDEIAEINDVTSAQVRKDLSFFGTFGKRGLGYNIEELKINIGKILGLDHQWNVAIIGVGNIGRALIDYAEFKKRGFFIKLLLDKDVNKIGRKVKNLEIKNFLHAESYLKKECIQIAIIAVPLKFAQNVADVVINAGVGAILNFAPLNIKTPDTVIVKNENMSIELEALSYNLTNN